MEKGISILSKTIVMLLLTGCVSNSMLSNNLEASNNQKALIFKTNSTLFINELENNTTQEKRNRYMDEFLLKSDVQCQQYLSSSQQKPQVDGTKNELYMNIFDTVSAVFGIKYITDTAKSMLTGNGDAQIENQKAYEVALSPEIKRGVEINRNRYAKEMKEKEQFSINKYTSKQLKKDILIYDKQCNEAYGLIEINRALKAMQNNLNRPKMAKTTINIEAVKNSVAKVTQKVQKKEKEKKKIVRQDDINAINQNAKNR